jgi:hypothetical protein
MYRNTIPGTNPHTCTSLLADNIADQIALAGHPVEIDEIIKGAWGHHFAGALTENDMEVLDEAARTRRAEIGRPPPQGPKPIGTAKSKLALGWPRRRPRRMPDREASRERARTLGGAAHMPPGVRGKYTEFERAALFIVAREVKHHGFCDLSVGRIAAEAGVCVRTVQNAEAEAIRQGHLCREERERKGAKRKNDTNVLRIMSAEWLTWIKRGPLGCKVCSATKSVERKKEAFEGRTGTDYRLYGRFGSNSRRKNE